MQKIFYIMFLILLTGILICGCQNKNNASDFKNIKYVEIPDYKHIEIEKDFTEITNDEIETIISADMSYNLIYAKVENRKIVEDGDIVLLDIDSKSKEYYEIGSENFGNTFDKNLISMIVNNCKSITIDGIDYNIKVLGIYRNVTLDDKEIIYKFYNIDSDKDLKNFIAKRAQDEIIYNYMWDYIYNNSKINDYPKEIKDKINSEIKNTEKLAHNSGKTLDEYLNEFDMTYNEYISNVYSTYNEFIIMEAILEQEKIDINNIDIKQYFSENKNKYRCTYKEFREQYTLDDIKFEIAEHEVRKILLDNKYIK